MTGARTGETESIATVGDIGVAGIILAAGRSHRMGRTKPLLPLGGEPLVRHVARAALSSGLAEVIVVVGYRSREVGAALVGLGDRLGVVDNPDYADGQSGSLRAGLAAVDLRRAAVMVLLGDQPEIDSRVIDRLLAAHAATGAAIARPSYRGVPGHPVLFDRTVFPDLSRLRGDAGARSLIRARPSSVVSVEVDASAPRDVDTPAAYAALVDRWEPAVDGGADASVDYLDTHRPVDSLDTRRPGESIHRPAEDRL